MALKKDEIPKKFKKRGKSSIIAQAVNHEQRLRFHTEAYLEAGQISRPVTVFLDWVKTLIPKDKYKIFVQLFKFPTSMIDLTDRIYHELEKVFDGRNSAVNFQFTDNDLNADWEDYSRNVLKQPRVWRETGWDVLKTAVNSLVVVDLPREQTSERPEPYFYFLGIENVIDYAFLPNGRFEYVIFRISKNRIAVYDDENYRVYRVDEKSDLGELIVDETHDLGYCPVAWFWDTPIANKIPDIKKNPITPQLTNYDWALFFGVSKKHLDLYAPYPIYSAYESDCDFMNNETSEYCDGGFLRNSDNDYMVLRDGTVRQCPVCAEKKIVGVGSFVEVPVPKGDSPDLKDPINITTVDKDSLEFNVAENVRLKSEIYNSVVGSGGSAIEKTSVNESQVAASFEEKKAVLNSLKVNFEKIIMFTNDTICKLRYGSEYIGMVYNMGTEFYIYSIDDLHNQFTVAKKNGVNESQLNAILEQIIYTEYRNDPVQLQRMLLLKELEPYNLYTREELINLKKEGLVDNELLNVKINFNSFVERFERENTNILEFGSLISRDKKVSIITEKLKEYGTESNSSGAKED